MPSEIKFTGPKDPNSSDAVAPNSIVRRQSFNFTGPKDPEKPKEPEWYERAGQFGLDTLRSFNDTLTFGLMNKGLEATGVDPDATQKLEDARIRNPAAGIVGDTLGYMLPGFGASAAVAKAIPKLAKNSMGAVVGREAVASGALSATDDVVRDGTIDPLGVGIDAVTGGAVAGGVKGIGHMISPQARMRSAGNDLTGADKLNADYLFQRADAQGIPLRVNEAVEGAAPTRSQPLTSVFEDALQTPKGAQAAQSFEARRGPTIEAAGREMADQLGPGLAPFEVTRLAKGAVNRNKDLVMDSAEPHYLAAERAGPLNPGTIPHNASVEMANRGVRGSTEKMGFLRDRLGLGPNDPIGNDSVLFQDMIKKQLDELGKSAMEGSNASPLVSSMRFRAADDVSSAITRASPDYGVATDIAEQGMRRINELEAGPLGTLAENVGTAKSQASTLYGVDNATDADASLQAIKQLNAQHIADEAASGAAFADPRQASRGILANAIDSGVTNNGARFGKEILPNDYARMLAGESLGPEFADVAARLDSAALASPYTGQSLPGHDGSVLSKIQSGIFNFGKEGVVKAMEDPATIYKLGRMGAFQSGVTGVGRAANQAADYGGRVSGNSRSERRKRRNRGED